MSVISVNCVDQNLTITDKPNIYSGDVGNDEVQFTFCNKWTGFTKTASFKREGNNETVYHVAIDGDGKCTIPNEVIAETGNILFGVFGINEDGVVITSQQLKYKIGQGAYKTGETPDPTPSEYEQLMTAMSAALTACNEALSTIGTFRTEVTTEVNTFETNVSNQLDEFESTLLNFEDLLATI